MVYGSEQEFYDSDYEQTDRNSLDDSEKSKKRHYSYRRSTPYYLVDGREISTTLYNLSGATTTTMTFVTPWLGGMGHFMQGRVGSGLFFLASPAIAFTGALAQLMLAPKSGGPHGFGIMLGWGLAFVGLKVWENVDIWSAPKYVHGGRLRPRQDLSFNLSVSGEGMIMPSLSLNF